MRKLKQDRDYIGRAYRWAYRDEENFVLAVGTMFGLPMWIHSLLYFSSQGELGMATIFFTALVCMVGGAIFGAVIWRIPFFQQIKAEYEAKEVEILRKAKETDPGHE